MASRRDRIRAALLAALEELDLAGGVQELRRPQNEFATLPTIVLAQLDETKVPGTTSTYECAVQFAVDAFPEQTEGTVIEGVDDLVESIERVLLEANQQEPVLGVPGCLEVVLGGSEPFALDAEQLVGAAVAVTVRYRHDIDDPAKFGGSTS